jgi:hypothetical protein
MGKARIINAIFWLWLWLSDVFTVPVATDPDYWTETGKRLFRFNENIVDDPARFLGNAVIPALLWFAIDRGLRRWRRPENPGS